MLNQEQIQANKQEFQNILREVITLEPNKQKGTENLLQWLEGTDFYTAPASTKYHQSYNGGLCEHSLQVYKHLLKIIKDYELNNIPKSSLIIVALLHDLCKINTYKLGTRNVKNEQTGQWEKVPVWEHKNTLHMGHAEKSLFYITQFYQLNNIEYQAILFHMGYCDLGNYRTMGETSEAFQENKLAFALHFSDMASTYLENQGI